MGPGLAGGSRCALDFTAHTLNTDAFIHGQLPGPLGLAGLLPRRDIAAADTELLKLCERCRRLQTAGFGAGEQLRDSSKVWPQEPTPAHLLGVLSLPLAPLQLGGLL